jgi:hypothetical protein
MGVEALEVFEGVVADVAGVALAVPCRLIGNVGDAGLGHPVLEDGASRDTVHGVLGPDKLVCSMVSVFCF